MDKWSQQQELHVSPANRRYECKPVKTDGHGHCMYFQQPCTTLIKISGLGQLGHPVGWLHFALKGLIDILSRCIL